MRESWRNRRPLSRTNAPETSIAVYGDVSLADHMILRGPAGRVDLLAVYLRGGRVVAAVCIGQTVRVESLIKRAVAHRALPIDNLADTDASLEDAFFYPAAVRTAA